MVSHHKKTDVEDRIGRSVTVDEMILGALSLCAKSGSDIYPTGAGWISSLCLNNFVYTWASRGDLISKMFRGRLHNLAQRGTLDAYRIANDDETLPPVTLYALTERSKPRAEICMRMLKNLEQKTEKKNP